MKDFLNNLLLKLYFENYLYIKELHSFDLNTFFGLLMDINFNDHR